MIPIRRHLALLVLLGLGAACSDNPVVPPGPRPGTLTLRLTTPNGDDGALLFEVSGAPVDTALAARTGLQLYTRRGEGTALTGALVGDLTGGAVVTLRVPDVGAADRYAVRVLEVADRRSELRSSPAGYALTLMP